MIAPQKLVSLLKEHSIDFFAGVPDSLLKNLGAYLDDALPPSRHIIAANEGNAAALAAGHYLATSQIGCVYMQNSGIGNAVNPLLSLLDDDVYAIPALLIIGWRGDGTSHDEPQHARQGKLTLPLLDVMRIEYSVLDKNTQNIDEIIDHACKVMQNTLRPYALVVRKGTFENSPCKIKTASLSAFERERAIGCVAAHLPSDAVIVSTTGKISRELYEYRLRHRQDHSRDFLNVGSMGHASSIAAAIALSKPNSPVFCFDGDGALLMHLGALAVIGRLKLKNFKHIVFNNGAHESVGGQSTALHDRDLKAIALDCGYEQVFCASDEKELVEILPKFANTDALSFLEIKTALGSRSDLLRPKESPQENKKSFMQMLGSRQ